MEKPQIEEVLFQADQGRLCRVGGAQVVLKKQSGARPQLFDFRVDPYGLASSSVGGHKLPQSQNEDDLVLRNK